MRAFFRLRSLRVFASTGRVSSGRSGGAARARPPRRTDGQASLLLEALQLAPELGESVRGRGAQHAPQPGLARVGGRGAASSSSSCAVLHWRRASLLLVAPCAPRDRLVVQLHPVATTPRRAHGNGHLGRSRRPGERRLARRLPLLQPRPGRGRGQLLGALALDLDAGRACEGTRQSSPFAAKATHLSEAVRARALAHCSDGGDTDDWTSAWAMVDGARKTIS